MAPEPGWNGREAAAKGRTESLGNRAEGWTTTASRVSQLPEPRSDAAPLLARPRRCAILPASPLQGTQTKNSDCFPKQL
jgi:hypothetical protein